MHKNDSSGFQGYCIDLIEELKVLMGFEYEIYEVPEYGNMNSTMHWNGLIKELVDKVSQPASSRPASSSTSFAAGGRFPLAVLRSFAGVDRLSLSPLMTLPPLIVVSSGDTEKRDKREERMH